MDLMYLGTYNVLIIIEIYNYWCIDICITMHILFVHYY